MMEILKMNKGVFEKKENIVKNSWINMVNPTDSELDMLASIVDIPEEVILSLKDTEEIPTIDRYPGLLSIIIQVPKDTPTETRYETVPFGILKTKSHTITISYEKTSLSDLIKKRKDVKSIVLESMFTSARLYLKYLREINRETYDVRNHLEKATENEEILELMELEKSLIYFNTSIRNNIRVVERLKRFKDIVKTSDDKDLYEDIQEEYHQAISMAKIYSVVVTTTLNAFSAVISNNASFVMKTLTSVTIILMLPTLIASIYGMNIPLPLQDSPYALGVISIATIFLVTLGVVLFRKRKFF